MRPLSAVPIKTLPGCKPGAMANAVIDGELQTTSAPPSGKMRNTALREAGKIGTTACGLALRLNWRTTFVNCRDGHRGSRLRSSPFRTVVLPAHSLIVVPRQRRLEPAHRWNHQKRARGHGFPGGSRQTKRRPFPRLRCEERVHQDLCLRSNLPEKLRPAR